MPENDFFDPCGNARRRKNVRCTIAGVICGIGQPKRRSGDAIYPDGTSMTSISLHGRVAVKPAAQKSLKTLIATLQPDSDDVIAIEQGILHIQIGNCDAPSGFHEVACNAVAAFCEKYATAGAVFDFDGSALVVGPGPQARRDAHASYLVGRIQALTSELDRVLSSG